MKNTTGKICLLFMGLLFELAAQKSQVNLCWHMGRTMMVNQKEGKLINGPCSQLGMNLFLTSKEKVMIFKPELVVTFNNFDVPVMAYNAKLRITQNLLTLHLDALLKAGKKFYIKAGIFGAMLNSTSIDLITRTAGATFYYGTSDYLKGYDPLEFQAGIATGIYFPFKIKSAEFNFNATVLNYGTSIVRNSYFNSPLMGTSEKPILSNQLIPASITIGFEIAVKRFDKSKNKVVEAVDE